MTIRPARVEDADAIALAHVRAWQAAYRGTFPDTFLDAMDVAARAGYWREELVADQPTVFVADVDGVVAGFAAAGPSRDDAPPASGELWAINLNQDAWGSGAARPLQAAALDALRAQGHRDATLWVVAGNHRAMRFYADTGWHDEGTTKDAVVAGTTVTEHRYRRAL